MKESISGADMFQGNLTTLTSDRFGCVNSALALNGGWAQIPSGIYFNTPEFTISLWVFPQSSGSWSRVIDFSNDGSDSIILSLTSGITNKPCLMIYSGNTQIILATSSQPINIGEWQFLAATFNGTNTRIYINGQLTVDCEYSFSLNSLMRSQCYVGKSNVFYDGYSMSYLDDLKLFNKSLTQDEIFQLVYGNDTSRIFLNNSLLNYI
jgi:hypothetical protein